MKVQVTVVVYDGLHTRLDSTTLLVGRSHGPDAPEDVVANAARLVGAKAIYGGRLRPTPIREGGRG